MQKYKASQYNYCLETKAHDLILYNTFHGSFLKISAQQKDFIVYLLSRKDSLPADCETEYAEELMDKGFLVPVELDEFAALDYLYLDLVNNNDLGITIFTTEQCNFRCKYCYEPFEHGAMSVEVQDRIIRFVRKHIKKYRSLEISWFGGEPLMGLDVIRRMSKAFMEICHFYKKPYFASITTNGYLLTEDIFRELLSYHIVKYQITLDGDKQNHDKQRVLADGSGTFDRIIQNLIAIKQNVKSKRFDIMLRTNYTKPIYQSMDSFLILLEKNFNHDRRFSMLPRLANDMGGESVKTMIGDLYLSDWKSALNSIYDKLIDSDLVLNFGAMDQLLQPGAGICYASKKNIFSFDTKGIMHKCQSGYQRDNLSVIGKPSKDGREIEIDDLETYKWICRPQQLHPDCKACFYLPVCFGSACSLKNYIQGSGPMSSKPSCPYEKATLDGILLLMDKSGYFDRK